MILFAVISGRGGCWVGDPVKAAFQGRSGNITSLVRPHAVPGVLSSTVAMWKSGGRLHLRAIGTTWRLAWSGEGGVVLDGRCGLSERSGKQGPASWEGRQ